MRRSGSRTSRTPQHRIELAGVLERVEIVAAADRLAVDEDLRHRGPSFRFLRHFNPLARLHHDIDFLELNALLIKEPLGTCAIRAPGAGIDDDFGHGTGTPIGKGKISVQGYM